MDLLLKGGVYFGQAIDFIHQLAFDEMEAFLLVDFGVGLDDVGSLGDGALIVGHFLCAFEVGVVFDCTVLRTAVLAVECHEVVASGVALREQFIGFFQFFVFFPILVDQPVDEVELFFEFVHSR